MCTGRRLSRLFVYGRPGEKKCAAVPPNSTSSVLLLLLWLFGAAMLECMDDMLSVSWWEVERGRRRFE